MKLDSNVKFDFRPMLYLLEDESPLNDMNNTLCIMNYSLDFIRSNKLLLLFHNKLIKKLVLPFENQLSIYMEGESDQMDLLLHELYEIAVLFKNENINFMVVKTIKSLQCELSDLDLLLLTTSDLENAKSILLKNAYFVHENKRPLSKSKNCYNKSKNDKIISIDLHNDISYGGVNINKNKLWDRKREFIIRDKTIYIPSIEDELLIQISHNIYENGKIVLYDLLYLYKLLSKNIDFYYVLSTAREAGFYHPLLLYINYLMNCLNVLEIPLKIKLPEKLTHIGNKRIYRALFKNCDHIFPLSVVKFSLFSYIYKIFCDLSNLRIYNLSKTIPDFIRFLYMCLNLKRRGYQ